MVEHSSISPESELEPLARNLSETYLAIASGVPGTTIENHGDWQAATNQFAHPICNFAVMSSGAPAPVAELKALSNERKFFNIYLPRSEQENPTGEQLMRSGFRKLYVLHQMVGRSPSASDSAVLKEAIALQEREKLAEFMALQFFGSQSPAVRRQIMYASLSSPELKLYELMDVSIRQRPIGAVMLHRTPGVLGLYNLCVAPAYRGQGRGSSIVNAVLLQAGTEHVIVGLQCDPALCAWYEQLGLHRVGFVDVFGSERG